MSFELRVGDRFQRILTGSVQPNSVWEYIGDDKSICMVSTSVEYPVGMITSEWNFTMRGWKYLGNFAKTDNFNELYDLLNQ